MYSQTNWKEASMFDAMEDMDRCREINPKEILAVAFVYLLEPTMTRSVIPAFTEVGAHTCSAIAKYIRAEMAKYIMTWQMYQTFTGEMEADETSLRKASIKIIVRITTIFM